jgi:Fe-Mn family superoxide dismutase
MIHQLYVLEGFVENKDLIHTSFANARKSRQDYVDSIFPVEMSIAAKFLNQKLIKLADKTKSTRLLALASKKNLKDFSQILDNPVVSKELTEAHIGLYEGYVKSLNGIVSELDSANTESANYSYGKYSELKRRLAIPYNGALLHELYFEHLKPIKQAAPKDELLQLINNRWGSLEKYFADIKATGLSAGNGWVITAYDPALERLDNYLITEHHIGIPVGLTPILVLDTWEHAYAADYLTKKDEYFDAFLDNLSFDILEERLSLESK